jgi:hypothetical protein
VERELVDLVRDGVRERDLLEGRAADDLVLGRGRVAPRGEDEAIGGRLPTWGVRTRLPARCVATLE